MTFDSNFPIIAGMCYLPPIPGPILRPIPPSLDKSHGMHGNNADWRLVWVKKIGHLQQNTDEQEEVGADPEWYPMMLFCVWSTLMPSPMNPKIVHATAAPHMQLLQPSDRDTAAPATSPAVFFWGV